jgi:uncharacterized protein (DUF433 family)
MRFERITVHPDQMGGVPCIRGLRIPVATVVGMVADGMTVEEIVEALPDLEPQDVREALRFAAEAVLERQLPLLAPGNKHCFVPRYSKTDNFKVRQGVPVEIDTRFWKPGLTEPVDGLNVIWGDTVGASNVKWSEYNPAVNATTRRTSSPSSPASTRSGSRTRPDASSTMLTGRMARPTTRSGER